MRSVIKTATAGGLVAMGVVKVRRWNLTWGAAGAEVDARLPGDDLVPRPSLVATRAITIHAPARGVWPWVAQLGYGRGGYYSYDVLENAIGLDIHSADAINAQWQDLAPGDPWYLVDGFALEVAVVDVPHAFVVFGSGEGPEAPPFSFTWAFVLVPDAADPAVTRLIVRERYGYAAAWVALMVEPVSWMSLIMTSKMMRGIRDRAEGRVVGPAGSLPGGS